MKSFKFSFFLNHKAFFLALTVLLAGCADRTFETLAECELIQTKNGASNSSAEQYCYEVMMEREAQLAKQRDEDFRNNDPQGYWLSKQTEIQKSYEQKLLKDFQDQYFKELSLTEREEAVSNYWRHKSSMEFSVFKEIHGVEEYQYPNFGGKEKAIFLVNLFSEEALKKLGDVRARRQEEKERVEAKKFKVLALKKDLDQKRQERCIESKSKLAEINKQIEEIRKSESEADNTYTHRYKLSDLEQEKRLIIKLTEASLFGSEPYECEKEVLSQAL